MRLFCIQVFFLLKVLPFCSTNYSRVVFGRNCFRIPDSINKPFVSDHFLYYDPNKCKWRLEDQQPCSTEDPSTVVSTTTLTTTDFSSTEITSTVVATTEVPTTKTTELSTEATTTADKESCEKLDAQWSCSSGTGKLLTPDYGPSELIAHLFLHNDLIPF